MFRSIRQALREWWTALTAPRKYAAAVLLVFGSLQGAMAARFMLGTSEPLHLHRKVCPEIVPIIPESSATSLAENTAPAWVHHLFGTEHEPVMKDGKAHEFIKNALRDMCHEKMYDELMVERQGAA